MRHLQEYMVFVIGAVFVALVAFISRGVRVPQTVHLGSVSQQWLAEYRASHPGR
jgi:hypothetical protein